MALLRYRFAVVEWHDHDRRRQVQVLTDEGVHKAAWVAGASFSAAHPRTPIRSLTLVSAEQPEDGPDGVVIVQDDDVQDSMELR